MKRFAICNVCGNAKSKTKYFGEDMMKAFDQAYKLCNQRKRDIEVMVTEDDYIEDCDCGYKTIYIIHYCNGGISREKVIADL